MRDSGFPYRDPTKAVLVLLRRESDAVQWAGPGACAPAWGVHVPHPAPRHTLDVTAEAGSVETIEVYWRSQCLHCMQQTPLQVYPQPDHARKDSPQSPGEGRSGGGERKKNQTQLMSVPWARAELGCVQPAATVVDKVQSKQLSLSLCLSQLFFKYPKHFLWFSFYKNVCLEGGGGVSAASC